jgi:hypothetical protein
MSGGLLRWWLILRRTWLFAADLRARRGYTFAWGSNRRFGTDSSLRARALLAGVSEAARAFTADQSDIIVLESSS